MLVAKIKFQQVAMGKLLLVEECWNEELGYCTTKDSLLYTFLMRGPASVVTASVAGVED